MHPPPFGPSGHHPPDIHSTAHRSDFYVQSSHMPMRVLFACVVDKHARTVRHVSPGNEDTSAFWLLSSRPGYCHLIDPDFDPGGFHASDAKHRTWWISTLCLAFTA
ncbi:hypothetical protein TEQG_05539 [Trichophyton equinum CBS 127.97]|uniref:Uncharacterized protein n=1 Tax=Trichophyton equinum (strain ATCC MYA-4606 / CBS 127.97) TaxID=559882 RepID=F2PXC1_TRIEC|nr:hypothetical protein TEQG_05539 [Trichophyton equinum CBS 127.97]